MARRRISNPAGPRTGAASRGRRPAPARPASARTAPAGDARAQLDRIREISTLARTTWFGLVAYLAFVGITLLGVEDADFFVPARQTKLPLVDVTIPTASFFLFAPILGAALYAYLHLQLVKLWEALAAAPAEIEGRLLGEHVYPWLINDLALGFRYSEVPRPPLRWLATLVTRLLVWIAAPAVLAFAWWRSMPAHDEWLTLAIALCLLLALRVGFTSWWEARLKLGGEHRAPWSGRWKRPLFWSAAALVLAVSWLRTEAGFDHYVNRAMLAWETVAELPPPGTYATDNGRPDADAREEWVAARILALDDLTFRFRPPLLEGEIVWTTLAPTDLTERALGEPPVDWRDRDQAFGRFREGWCERRNLTEAACRALRHLWRLPDTEERVEARDGWCRLEVVPGQQCLDRWSGLETAFREDWQEERNAYLRNLRYPDQPGRDLRGADLTSAFLPAANLADARLDGAMLRSARLEGTDLRRARLQGADLTWTRLQGAVLIVAQLQGANLYEARLDGAVLRGARLEGAQLEGAWMDGADLGHARLAGANLREARLNGAQLGSANLQRTDLEQVQMAGADLRRANLQEADLIAARLTRADLRRARLQGAGLYLARLVGADLRDALLDGADLRSADLRSVTWGSEDVGAAPAEAADLRGAVNLTQAQLASLVGDPYTLLPDGPAPDSGEPYYIPSCWIDPPESIIALLERASSGIGQLREQLRQRWICRRGGTPTRTGTPLPLDAPRPGGHPLGPD